MHRNQYIVRHGEDWAVVGEGNSRPTKITSTQAEAIQLGRSIAKNQESELRIQGKDGRFRECNSYGKDPFPPRG